MQLSEDQRTTIIEKLTAKNKTETSFEDLQQQIDQYGHFETDKLPEGAQITFRMFDNGRHADIKGRVVTIKDEAWVSVLYSTNIKLAPHSLIRLGHWSEGIQDFVYEAIPHTPTNILQKDSSSSIQPKNIYTYRLQEFTVNDKKLRFERKF